LPSSHALEAPSQECAQSRHYSCLSNDSASEFCCKTPMKVGGGCKEGLTHGRMHP
jgi:hypothetical protein